MQVANRKMGASLKVDVDIPWVRFSTIESAFDLYTCTKLETEPQRTLPAVLNSHLGRGLTGLT